MAPEPCMALAPTNPKPEDFKVTPTGSLGEGGGVKSLIVYV